MKTWLLFDCHYLCHRAYHSTRGLSYKGSPTGVIFGFLKSINAIKDRFRTDLAVFCFEHPHLHRKDIYPEYKTKRTNREMAPEEKKAFDSFKVQIAQLRQTYLPEIGFENVFCFNGFESDDVMAAIARDRPKDENVVIVSSDSDMFQCLSENVSVYSPQTDITMTPHSFIMKHGIPPKQWAKVKAIAGCSSDGVEGIKGIGEKTAIKYLRGELEAKSSARGKILSRESKAIIRRNRKLVQLPFEGCPSPELKKDCITRKKWLSVAEKLGMRSMAKRPPVYSMKTVD